MSPLQYQLYSFLKKRFHYGAFVVSPCAALTHLKCTLKSAVENRTTDQAGVPLSQTTSILLLTPESDLQSKERKNKNPTSISWSSVTVINWQKYIKVLYKIIQHIIIYVAHLKTMTVNQSAVR